MKLGRVRTETRTEAQWGLGLWAVLLLALALVLGAMAMAQLKKLDLNEKHLPTPLQPSAAQPGDLRIQLNRLRRLEAGLVGARSSVEVQALTEQVAQQLQRFKALETHFASLLEGSEERMRFAAYSTSRDEYLQWQQHILGLASALDFQSAESRALTSAALVKAYGDESQNSFVAAASALEQWQQDNAQTTQQAGALARQLAAGTRGWILWALVGAALLVLALAVGLLLLLLARSRSSGSTRTSSFRQNAGRRQGDRDPAHANNDWRDTRSPLQPRSVPKDDWLDLRANAPDLSVDSGLSVTRDLTPDPRVRKTRVTAEDWDSF